MCGICGFVTNRPDVQGEAIVARMTAALVHRGPDSDGSLSRYDEGVYLGFRRLSIIDLSVRGSQPMTNETGTIWLVFNGEIYNHRLLRLQLERAGHCFKSETDSEVLLHGYEEWGLDFVDRLRGMFGFALWDGHLRRLILGRDRIGIKPLYFLDLGHLFAFASEARAFKGFPRDFWKPELDMNALSDVLALGYLPGADQSVLKGVKSLAPGTLLVREGTNIREHRYWTLGAAVNGDVPTYHAAQQELSGRLSESVRLMLHADVPVGVLLSGGLDSSIVTALAQRHVTQPVRTFTVGYRHAKDERGHAATVSEFLGTTHTAIELDYTNIFEKLPKICAVYDDLTSVDGGFVSTYLIAEQVRSHGVKVALVGEGGDEIFGGYPPFFMARWPWNWLPASVRAGFHFYAFGRTMLMPSGLASYRRFKTLLNETAGDELFQRLTRFEIEHQLPHNYLMKVDKGTMAHGLEARVPYLDESVVEYAYALPSDYKMVSAGFGWDAVIEKRILRDIGRKLLPAAIAARRKQGFSLPQETIVSENSNAVSDLLRARGTLAGEMIGTRQLCRLLAASRRPKGLVTRWSKTLLWRLLTAEFWWRSWQQDAA